MSEEEFGSEPQVGPATEEPREGIEVPADGSEHELPAEAPAEEPAEAPAESGESGEAEAESSER